MVEVVQLQQVRESNEDRGAQDYSKYSHISHLPLPALGKLVLVLIPQALHSAQELSVVLFNQRLHPFVVGSGGAVMGNLKSDIGVEFK